MLASVPRKAYQSQLVGLSLSLRALYLALCALSKGELSMLLTGEITSDNRKYDVWDMSHVQY